MEAVNRRNWAITVQLPAATSWSSLMYKEMYAKTTAAINDDTAIVYSALLDFVIYCFIRMGAVDGRHPLDNSLIDMF